MNLLPRKAGIYRIRHVPSDRCYIGQSMNMLARQLGHLAALEKGTHSCEPLLTDYRRDGETAFEFEMVELLPCENSPANRRLLLDRESHWIDKTENPYNALCYSQEARERAAARRKRLQRECLEETRELLVAWTTHTPEHRAELNRKSLDALRRIDHLLHPLKVEENGRKAAVDYAIAAKAAEEKQKTAHIDVIRNRKFDLVLDD